MAFFSKENENHGVQVLPLTSPLTPQAQSARDGWKDNKSYWHVYGLRCNGGTALIALWRGWPSGDSRHWTWLPEVTSWLSCQSVHLQQCAGVEGIWHSEYERLGLSQKHLLQPGTTFGTGQEVVQSSEAVQIQCSAWSLLSHLQKYNLLKLVW